MKITKKILISALAISPLTTLAFIPSVVRPNEVKTYSNTIYDDLGFLFLWDKEVNYKDYADVFELLIKEFGFEPQKSWQNDYDSIRQIPRFIKYKKDELNKKIVKSKELSASMLKDYKEINQDFVDGSKKKDKFNINEYLTNKRVKKYSKYKSKFNGSENYTAELEPVDFITLNKVEKRSQLNSCYFIPWKRLDKNDFKKPLIDDAFNPMRGYLIGINRLEYKTLEDWTKKIIEVNNNYVPNILKRIEFNIKLMNIYLDYLNNKLKLLEEIENIFLTVMMKDDYKESMKKYYSSEALKTLILKIRESESELNQAAKNYTNVAKDSKDKNRESHLNYYDNKIKQELNKMKELSDHKRMLEKHFKIQ